LWRPRHQLQELNNCHSAQSTSCRRQGPPHCHHCGHSGHSDAHFGITSPKINSSYAAGQNSPSTPLSTRPPPRKSVGLWRQSSLPCQCITDTGERRPHAHLSPSSSLRPGTGHRGIHVLPAICGSSRPACDMREPHSTRRPSAYAACMFPSRGEGFCQRRPGADRLAFTTIMAAGAPLPLNAQSSYIRLFLSARCAP